MFLEISSRPDHKWGVTVVPAGDCHTWVRVRLNRKQKIRLFHSFWRNRMWIFTPCTEQESLPEASLRGRNFNESCSFRNAKRESQNLRVESGQLEMETGNEIGNETMCGGWPETTLIYLFFECKLFHHSVCGTAASLVRSLLVHYQPSLQQSHTYHC